MAEIMISGTVMICVVLIVRRLTLGKISMRLRYALWLAVALRLMIPFHFGSSPYSIMSGMQQIGQHYGYMAKNVQTGADGIYDPGEKTEPETGAAASAGDRQSMAQNTPASPEQVKAQPDAGDKTGAAAGNMADGAAEPEKSATTDAAARLWNHLPVNRRFGLRTAAAAAWIIGMVAAGGFMLVRQVRFITYLHRVREQAQTNDLPEAWVQRLSERRLRVWLVRGLPSPCMAGRGIYISPELYGDVESRLHILAHEYAHAVQRDDLWAAVRSVLCIVWWFWPPVWLAAYAAKQDSELACDERAVRLLGETQRFSYGRTLLALANGGHDRRSALGVVVSMDGSGRRIRQRISVIADTGRRSKIAAGAAVLTVLLLCGCAYTGAQTVQEKSAAGSTEDAGSPAVKQPETAQAAAGQAQPESAQAEAAVEPAQADQAAGRQMAAEAERSAAVQAEEEMLHRQEETEAEYSAVLQEREEMLRRRMEELAVLEQEQEQWQRQLAQQQRQIQEELEQVEAELRQVTGREFAQVLSAETDEALESAVWIDRMEYFDYLYNDGPCPMEDGMWYLIYRNERYSIDFYGFYTDKYGSRGVKMLIDGDVNTLDIPWRSALYESGIEVFMIERTQDGLPRTFAFQMCEELTGEYARWNLYLVDRYDTGTIDFYTFDEEACQEQFRNMVDFRIDYERQKILLLYKGDVIKGGIDLLAYQDYTVEDAFWSGAGIRYYAADDDEYPIYFATNVGVKLAETQEIQYENLSRIVCPVSIGEWGDRSFTLGSPGVELR